jgi:pimeloyl-ACP methyl ester carboxylesterase
MEMRLLRTYIVTLKNDKRLRVARLGSGPPIVLLHGYPENLQIWNRLAPPLAERFEVVAFDWPGQGYSDEWPGGASPELLAERLRLILDELHIQKPVLVGMDMGGQPALAFAARFPEQISHLVVMNSLVFGDEKTSWEISLLRRFGFNRFALKYLPQIIFWRAQATFLPKGKRLDVELRRDFWEAFQGTLARLPKLYEKITCPTLVLWGECDKHFPPVQAERLQRTIPGSQMHLIPGGTHWMVLEQEHEIAAMISRFIARSSAANN